MALFELALPTIHDSGPSRAGDRRRDDFDALSGSSSAPRTGVDAAVVGYASAQIQRPAETSIRHAQSTLSIQWLGVTAEWRRRGVGRALIEALRDEAERLEVAALLLDVWSFNVEARGFYDAMGFRSRREILSLDVPRPRGASI